MCTTVPPAKSNAPICINHPPPHTQWAIGIYTIVPHAMMNNIQAEVFILPTIAPEISAAVSPAKVNWNTINNIVGMDPVKSLTPMPVIKKCAGSAIKPLMLTSPKANGYP